MASTLPPPAPAPVARPLAYPVQPDRSPGLQVWGVLVLFGALLVVASQMVILVDAFDDEDGKDVASILMSFVGSTVIALSFVAAGAFARVPVGARVALLAVGAYLLTLGGPWSFLRFFGGLGGF